MTSPNSSWVSPHCLFFPGIAIENCTLPPAPLDQNAKINHAIVTDKTRFYLEVIVMVLANAGLSIFGTVSNIINIIVYAKMGLGDVVNVSLLGLAVSDLLSVVLVVWCSITYGLYVLNPPGLGFDPLTIWYVTAGWPHFIFSRVTCYITAMVSIERCLCVLAPFKVKEIITPKRIKFCLVFIFVVFPAAYIPVMKAHRLAWKFDANFNETRIMADYEEDRDKIQSISYYVNDIVLPTLSIFIVTVCATVTARSLHQNAEWKRENKIGLTKDSSGDATEKTSKPTAISGKEMKVVRMLVIVSAMFVVCYSPTVLLLYIRFVHPELAMMRTYHNLFISIYSFVFLLEISNSSLNIVVYYVMSSKFRTTFHSLFCKSKSMGLNL